MKIEVIKECGYEEAALGFSLSYNSTVERTKEILPKYAFGIPGESKFLESMVIWLDVVAPRFFWQEFDTYRIGVTKQSASTMHTIMKRDLTMDDFERSIGTITLDWLNNMIRAYRSDNDPVCKEEEFLNLKNLLPEGFLQRRIVSLNYKALQNIHNQRKSHRLPQWHVFLDAIISQIEHPEFIIQNHKRRDYVDN